MWVTKYKVFKSDTFLVVVSVNIFKERIVTRIYFKGQVFSRSRVLLTCCCPLSPLPHRCAELLIMYHADVNHAAERGETPLYLACANGNNECVKLLLEAGADRSAKTCVSLKVYFSKSTFQENRSELP